MTPCPQCGHIPTMQTSFCPNCGATMVPASPSGGSAQPQQPQQPQQPVDPQARTAMWTPDAEQQAAATSTPPGGGTAPPSSPSPVYNADTGAFDEPPPNPALPIILAIVCFFCCQPAAIGALVTAIVGMSSAQTDPAKARKMLKISYIISITAIALFVLAITAYFCLGFAVAILDSM